MLKIRAEQFDALGHAEEFERFVTRTVEHVRSSFSGRVEEFGEDALQPRVRAAIAAGRRYGLLGERDLLRFINVTISLGLDYTDSPEEPPWLVEILTDPEVPDVGARTERLHKEAVHRLEVEAANEQNLVEYYHGG